MTVSPESLEPPGGLVPWITGAVTLIVGALWKALSSAHAARVAALEAALAARGEALERERQAHADTRAKLGAEKDALRDRLHESELRTLAAVIQARAGGEFEADLPTTVRRMYQASQGRRPGPADDLLREADRKPVASWPDRTPT